MSNKNHILLVCGALFGNGEEIDELQSFCLELKRQNRLILIRNDTDENILQILNIIADKNSEFNKDLSSSNSVGESVPCTGHQLSHPLSTSKNDTTTSPSNSSLFSLHLSSFSSSVPFPS